jgi:hypothetical protein
MLRSTMQRYCRCVNAKNKRDHPVHVLRALVRTKSEECLLKRLKKASRVFKFESSCTSMYQISSCYNLLFVLIVVGLRAGLCHCQWTRAALSLHV